MGAFLRGESRGAHYRRDFPQRNDGEWLKHSLMRRDENGYPSVSYSEVAITNYHPMERTY